MSEPSGSRARLWLLGARPRTLSISLAPIVVGLAHAATLTPTLAVWPVIAAALSALFIQIVANLANDAADGARGVDGPARLGPRRLAGAGLMPAATVAAGAGVATVLAAAFGLVAARHGGFPILALGAASLAAAWGYSFGPRPISASPLGEALVVLFFGVAAVAGVVWLAAARIDGASLALGLAIGLPAAGVLTVNNHRDRAQDAANGRRTWAIRLGERRTIFLYAAEMIAAGPIAAAALAARAPLGAAFLAAFAIAGVWSARRLAETPIGRGLDRRLAETAQFQIALTLAIAGVAVLEQ